MTTHRYRTVFLVLAVALCTIACNRRTVYSHYEHTPISGWEKNDTLHFSINPLEEPGTYHEEIGLRIDNSYPFMGLSLVVEETIFPLGYTTRHVVNCNLIDKNGTIKGNGVSYFQYNFPVNDLQLNKGDSLHICVMHNMKREIMPGIADIGISLTRK